MQQSYLQQEMRLEVRDPNFARSVSPLPAPMLQEYSGGRANLLRIQQAHGQARATLHMHSRWL
jgi:hypothetical protein